MNANKSFICYEKEWGCHELVSGMCSLTHAVIKNIFMWMIFFKNSKKNLLVRVCCVRKNLFKYP